MPTCLQNGLNKLPCHVWKKLHASSLVTKYSKYCAKSTDVGKKIKELKHCVHNKRPISHITVCTAKSSVNACYSQFYQYGVKVTK